MVKLIETDSHWFGDGKLVGDKPLMIDGLPTIGLLQLPIEEQTAWLGASEACPVVLRLIKERGVSEENHDLRDRYAEIIFWFGHIRHVFDTLSTPRKDLSREMVLPLPRNPKEPIGKHDAEWIPEELHEKIFRSPMAYALPRMIVEYKGSGQDQAARLVTVLGYLEKAATKENTYNLLEVSVHFLELIVADLLANDQTETAGMLMRYLIGTGKLSEENCFHTYRKLFAAIQRLAPTVWSFYSAMDAETKAHFRLAELSALPTDIPVNQLELRTPSGKINIATVKFSFDELREIGDLKILLANAFSNEAVHASGWERDIFFNLRLPWGFELKDRTQALEMFRLALEKIRQTEQHLAERSIANANTKQLSQLRQKIEGFIRTAELPVSGN